MDLSYILNSPDVERIASALESIAGNTPGKVDKNQGVLNAGRMMIVDNSGMVAVGDKPAAGLNDAVRHFMETLFIVAVYTQNESTTINRLVSAMWGIDGVTKSGSTLTVNYSLNDPSRQGKELTFEM